MRVETLEGTAANHETRISAADVNINGKKILKYSPDWQPVLETILKLNFTVLNYMIQIWKELHLTMRQD